MYIFWEMGTTAYPLPLQPPSFCPCNAFVVVVVMLSFAVTGQSEVAICCFKWSLKYCQNLYLWAGVQVFPGYRILNLYLYLRETHSETHGFENP